MPPDSPYVQNISPESILTDRKPQFQYWKEVSYTLIVFTILPLILGVSMFTLYTLRKENTPIQPQYGAQIYAALPQERASVSGSVIAEDARVKILEKFLLANRSELAPHASFLVATADRYQLDWKLLPAIAQKESGLCRVIPPGSHNCWGWGIHSKGTLMFDNYEEAIDTVAKGLKEKYVDMGYTTPEKIMKKYAHPDSTTWADGVVMYMTQISELEL
jgi:hypothetical protein